MSNTPSQAANCGSCASQHVPRLLDICGTLIDLDKVLWLDYNKTKDRAWVVMQGVTWNSEGDYYDNAPYINNEEDLRKFERLWSAYVNDEAVVLPDQNKPENN